MSDHRAKIRMYRHGLGDCHLVRLKREGKPDYTILIDCGVILGTANAKAKIAEVVADIRKETGGVIDLLVVTHAHGDHVSGFLQAEDEFRALDVGQVWMAWTEDPTDEFAQSLLSDRNKAKEVLGAAENRMRFAGANDEADELAGIMSFFGASGGRTTEDAVQVARDLAKDKSKLHYVRPGDDPYRPEGVPARLMVLGPPRDEVLIRKSTPSGKNPETYEAAGYPMFMSQLGPIVREATGGPFSSLEEIPLETAKSLPFFRNHYWTGAAADDDWRRIDEVWLGSAIDLALKLDSDTNNTSLVLAIELDGLSLSGQPGRDVLLFAADAQVGNWLSWQNVVWPSPEGEQEAVGGLDLVRRAIVYKVGHHGSHNATLKAFLESMERLLVALNPVDQEMAKKKRWDHIPLPSLEAALKKQAKEGLVRADQPAPANPRIAEDPLFYEVSV